jgi:hypothetical protein
MSGFITPFPYAMMGYSYGFMANKPFDSIIVSVMFMFTYYFCISYFLVDLPNRNVFHYAFNYIVAYPIGSAFVLGLVGWICFSYILDIKRGLFRPFSKTLIKNIWAWQLLPLFLQFGWFYYYYRMGIADTYVWWVPPTAWVGFFIPHAIVWYMTYNIVYDVEMNGDTSQYTPMTKENGNSSTIIQQKVGVTAASVTRIYLFFAISSFCAFMSLYWVALFRTVSWASADAELWATMCAGLAIILVGLIHLFYNKSVDKRK